MLIAARRVGETGRAIGIDPTEAMRESAMASARDAGLTNRVLTLEGTSEDIPLPDASANVVISNGVLNLALDKRRAIREIYRVLAPGGRLYLADVFLGKDLKENERLDANLWAGCVAGALLEAELIRHRRRDGLPRTVSSRNVLSALAGLASRKTFHRQLECMEQTSVPENKNISATGQSSM